jgi:hypothetical protein
LVVLLKPLWMQNLNKGTYPSVLNKRDPLGSLFIGEEVPHVYFCT